MIKFTPREQDVFLLTKKGLSARKVAMILNISPKTVEFHVENIKRKMGVYSKIELLRRAEAA